MTFRTAAISLLVLATAGCTPRQLPPRPPMASGDPIPLTVGVRLADNRESQRIGPEIVRTWESQHLFERIEYPYTGGEKVDAELTLTVEEGHCATRIVKPPYLPIDGDLEEEMAHGASVIIAVEGQPFERYSAYDSISGRWPLHPFTIGPPGLLDWSRAMDRYHHQALANRLARQIWASHPPSARRALFSNEQR